MTYCLEASEAAREQIAEVTRFSCENAPAKLDLFEVEWQKMELLLSRHPEAGAPYLRRRGVRRTLLRQLQIWVYYRVFPEEQRLIVVAVRHTARGGEPKL